MLFESFEIKSLELRNRIVMAPMCQYSSNEKGEIKPWHLVHYTSRAIGGVGLIMLEATAVSPYGRISKNDLGIWSDEHVDGLKELTSLIHENGAKISIQLAHAGRKSKITSTSVAPSSEAFNSDYGIPKQLEEQDIREILSSFQHAARRAFLSGFDAVEIHAAHGYLINEFLSPLANHRKDSYGGSLANRTKFLREVIGAVKKEWPEDRPLFMRVSSKDYAKGGNDVSDMIQIVELLKKSVDVIDVSTGGVVDVPKTAVYPGYQLEDAFKIRNECSISTIGGGGITTADMAEYALQSNSCDLVYLGKELLRNPYWPLKSAFEMSVELPWPFQYKRGKYEAKWRSV